jgi:hypothetical protein
MRAYLLVSGTIFALFAVSHFAITYEHWRSAPQEFAHALVPLAIGVLGSVLALWAFRLARRGAAAPR